MATYRIYEIAEELGVESNRLVEMLREMGVSARSHMSTIDDSQKARLLTRFERERRSGAAGGDGKGGGRRRRRRRRRKREPEAADAAEAPETAEAAGAAATEEPPAAEGEDEEPDAEPAEVEVAAEAETEQEAVGAVEVDDVEEAAPPEVEVAGEEPSAEDAEGADEDDETAEVQEAEEVEEEAEVAEDVQPTPVDLAEGTEVVPSGEAAVEEEAEDAAPRKERKKDKKKRKPRPVRRDLSYRPAASAAPGGKVEIDEGYSSRRGKKRSGRKRKKRTDRDVVEENVKKTLAAMEGGGGGGSGTKKRRRRREEEPTEEEVERQEEERRAEKRQIRVNEFLTVAELADMIDTSPQEIITSAFKNLGLMVTINQRLDFDQIELICEEFGFEAEREEAYEAELPELEEQAEEEEDLVSRAPVVTVLGHVDHGKTSLLDYIREANVVAGESGGITQHIGAYRVTVDGDRAVTFLDTPGHEAFTAMRARGAEVTDMVILVVAADDGIMPQTEEAINHARSAGVPMVVAINKIDLPGADPDAVKQQLLSHEVVVEEFGGEVLSQPVSAETGEGIDELLEKILLQSELLELRANPDRDARGTVVESELDTGMGAVATILVQSGTLEVGDDFICGRHSGRVRALLDERGNNVESAGPSEPVRVLGIEGVPQAGDRLVVLEPDRVKEIAERRQELEREKDIRRRSKGTRLEDVFEEIQTEGRAQLNLIIKGDTDGSVQALSDSLERLSTDEVEVDVLHRGVGAVNESDVLLATTSDATILGFHVRSDSQARQVAEKEGVEIRTYDVIYEAVQEVRQALEGMLEPEEKEVVLGSAEVRQLFRVPKAGTVAGCYVQEGRIDRNERVRVYRDGKQIYEGEIGNLKRFKDDVREVKEGYECGLSVADFNDVKVGDVIECYTIEEVARTLESASS